MGTGRFSSIVRMGIATRLFTLSTAMLVVLATSAAFADEYDLATAEKKEVFNHCRAEGRNSLDIARFYYLSGYDNDELRLRVLGDTAAELRAEELIVARDAGEDEHYAFYAANKLYECFESNGVPLDKPFATAAACYLQVDIPYYLFSLKKQGYSKRDARKYVLRKMDDRQYFPRKIINKVADRVYTQGSEKIRDYIEGNVFWGCYYQEEWADN